MPHYNFRIRFHLQESERIKHDSHTLEISTENSDKNLTIQAKGDVPIKENSELVLTDSPYSSYEEAEEAGRNAKRALMLHSMRSKLGVDLGDDTWSGGLTKFGKEYVSNIIGARILDDIHGLMVYEVSEYNSDTRFSSSEVNAIVKRPSEPFVEGIKSALSESPSLSDKEKLSFDLYSASFFEESARARFLTLVIAIEALLEPPERMNEVRSLVSDLIAKVEDSDLPKAEIDSLRGSLERLRTDSIGRTGRNMTRRLLGTKSYSEREAPKFFQYCYSLRSKLVHEGRIDDENLNLGELTNFVGDLLEASATDSTG